MRRMIINVRVCLSSVSAYHHDITFNGCKREQRGCDVGWLNACVVKEFGQGVLRAEFLHAYVNRNHNCNCNRDTSRQKTEGGKQMQTDRGQAGRCTQPMQIGTDRRTETNKQRLTDRQTDRDRQAEADRQTNRQTDRPTDRHTDRQTDRRTDKQTDRQTDKQTDRQTDKQMERPSDTSSIGRRTIRKI